MNADGAAVRVNVIAPADLWRRFDKVAEAHERSRSGELRELMKQAVHDHEAGERADAG